MIALGYQFVARYVKLADRSSAAFRAALRADADSVTHLRMPGEQSLEVRPAAQTVEIGVPLRVIAGGQGTVLGGVTLSTCRSNRSGPLVIDA